MKRLITILVCWVMILSMCLCAATALAEKRHVTIMVWGNSANMENNIESIRSVYPDFFEEVEVEVIVGGSGDKEVAQQVRLALASNEPIADIVQLNYIEVPEFARAGVLKSVADVVEPYADRLLGGAIKLAQYEDEYVAVPYELKPKVMYYRKDIFDECGVNPNEWKTIDDMIAGGKKIQETYPDAYIWGCSEERGWSDYHVYMTMCAFDARFVDEEGNYIVDKDSGVRKALETLKKIKDSGVCYDAKDFTPDWEAAFGNSNLIAEPVSAWMKNYLSGYVPDQIGKWDTCLWPEEIRKGSDGGGSVFVIPTFTSNEADAKELLRMMRLEDEGALKIFVEQGRTPVTTTAMNSEAFARGHAFFGENTFKVEAEASNEENYGIFNYDPAAVAEIEIFSGWVTKYMSNRCTLDEALQGANNDMMNQIGNPYN